MCGKGGAPTISNTTQNQNVQFTPYGQAGFADIYNRAQQVASTPYTPYTGELVAPLNGYQWGGINQVMDSAQLAQPYLQAGGNGVLAGAGVISGAQNPLAAGQGMIQQGAGAINNAQGYLPMSAGMTMGAAQGVGNIGANDISQYMNPFQQNVIQATLANMAENNAQQQQQVQGNAAMRGALGGDRLGVAQAELARQQALANNQTLAGMNAQNYQQATQTALSQQQNQQANQARLLQAANQFGGLGATQAGIGTQLAGAGNAMTGAAGQQAGIGNLLAGTGLQYGNIGLQAQQAGIQGGQSLLGAGTVSQQNQQALDTALYQQYLQQLAFPYQQAQFMAGIGLPAAGAMGGFQTQIGQTNQVLTPPGMTLGQGIVGGGALLGGLFGGFKSGGAIPRFSEGGETDEKPQFFEDDRSSIDRDTSRIYESITNAMDDPIVPETKPILISNSKPTPFPSMTNNIPNTGNQNNGVTNALGTIGSLLGAFLFSRGGRSYADGGNVEGPHRFIDRFLPNPGGFTNTFGGDGLGQLILNPNPFGGGQPNPANPNPFDFTGGAPAGIDPTNRFPYQPPVPQVFPTPPETGRGPLTDPFLPNPGGFTDGTGGAGGSGDLLSGLGGVTIGPANLAGSSAKFDVGGGVTEEIGANPYSLSRIRGVVPNMQVHKTPKVNVGELMSIKPMMDISKAASGVPAISPDQMQQLGNVASRVMTTAGTGRDHASGGRIQRYADGGDTKGPNIFDLSQFMTLPFGIDPKNRFPYPAPVPQTFPAPQTFPRTTFGGAGGGGTGTGGGTNNALAAIIASLTQNGAINQLPVDGAGGAGGAGTDGGLGGGGFGDTAAGTIAGTGTTGPGTGLGPGGWGGNTAPGGNFFEGAPASPAPGNPAPAAPGTFGALAAQSAPAAVSAPTAQTGPIDTGPIDAFAHDPAGFFGAPNAGTLQGPMGLFEGAAMTAPATPGPLANTTGPLANVGLPDNAYGTLLADPAPSNPALGALIAATMEDAGLNQAAISQANPDLAAAMEAQANAIVAEMNANAPTISDVPGPIDMATESAPAAALDTAAIEAAGLQAAMDAADAAAAGFTGIGLDAAAGAFNAGFDAAGDAAGFGGFGGDAAGGFDAGAAAVGDAAGGFGGFGGDVTGGGFDAGVGAGVGAIGDAVGGGFGGEGGVGIGDAGGGIGDGGDGGGGDGGAGAGAAAGAAAAGDAGVGDGGGWSRGGRYRAYGGAVHPYDMLQGFEEGGDVEEAAREALRAKALSSLGSSGIPQTAQAYPRVTEDQYTMGRAALAERLAGPEAAAQIGPASVEERFAGLAPTPQPRPRPVEAPPREEIALPPAAAMTSQPAQLNPYAAAAQTARQPAMDPSQTGWGEIMNTRSPMYESAKPERKTPLQMFRSPRGLFEFGARVLAANPAHGWAGAIGQGALGTLGTFDKFENEDMSARQKAQDLATRIKKHAETLGEATRHHRSTEDIARERLAQDNWRFVGQTTTGAPLMMNTKTSEIINGATQEPLSAEEKMVLGGGKGGAGATGQTERIIAKIIEENPNLTYTEALGIVKKSGQSPDILTLRREALALSAAKADMAYLTKPAETIERYRKFYGAGAPQAAAAPNIGDKKPFSDGKGGTTIGVWDGSAWQPLK